MIEQSHTSGNDPPFPPVSPIVRIPISAARSIARSTFGELPDGRSYLIQAKRLAAYLQAGLLLPAEEEALTVRATREALAKLDANPERLLQ